MKTVIDYFYFGAILFYLLIFSGYSWIVCVF